MLTETVESRHTWTLIRSRCKNTHVNSAFILAAGYAHTHTHTQALCVFGSRKVIEPCVVVASGPTRVFHQIPGLTHKMLCPALHSVWPNNTHTHTHTHTQQIVICVRETNTTYRRSHSILVLFACGSESLQSVTEQGKRNDDLTN